MTDIFLFKIATYTVFAFILSVVDLESLRLPHCLTLPMAGLGFLFSFVPGNGLFPWESLLGFVAGIVPLGILSWHRQESFGFGDAVFSGAIGAFGGILGLGVSLVSSGIIAMIVFSLWKDRDLVAFGPMLAAGGVLGVILSYW